MSFLNPENSLDLELFFPYLATTVLQDMMATLGK